MAQYAGNVDPPEWDNIKPRSMPKKGPGTPEFGQVLLIAFGTVTVFLVLAVINGHAWWLFWLLLALAAYNSVLLVRHLRAKRDSAS